jgi:hypothetical protein
MVWGTVEEEPEVHEWLVALGSEDFGRVAFHIDLLANNGVLLDEPHTRQRDGKLRELRFNLHGERVRVTYWIAPDRRIILLTVFHKSQLRERREVARAKRAYIKCMKENHVTEEGS